MKDKFLEMRKGMIKYIDIAKEEKHSTMDIVDCIIITFFQNYKQKALKEQTKKYNLKIKKLKEKHKEEIKQQAWDLTERQ